MNTAKNIKILTIGIGCAGGKITRYLFENKLQTMNYVLLNGKATLDNFTEQKIIIGKNWERKIKGEQVDNALVQVDLLKNTSEIKTYLQGINMVFLVAGVGGVVGSQVTLLVVKILQDLGILTIVLAVTPLVSESKKRHTKAKKAITELKKCAVNTIVIANEKTLKNHPKANKEDTFILTNQEVQKIIFSIINAITNESYLNPALSTC